MVDKVLVPTYDEEGNEISREPIGIVKTVADTVPYGNVALNFFLLAFAGASKFKQYQTEKGLKATLLAGKMAAKDPKLKEMWEQVKEAYYKPSHASSGTTSLIKKLLAKI